MAALRSLVLCSILISLPATVLAVPVTLAAFDFEDGMGGPDPQGFEPRIERLPDQAYAHVEDFTGADHEGAPLAGNQSFWWGLAAEDPRTCHWSAPPGYGSLWNEVLVSRVFDVEGDVEIGFLADQYMDSGYDGASLEYEEPEGTWNQLALFDCGFQDCGPTQESFVVPAASHDGSLRFRFHFFSDGAVDNEGSYFSGVFDIGFTLDSLTVSDSGGIVDFQDFEAEAPGDSITADGDWHTAVYDAGPHHALLADGSGVVQDAPEQNATNLWGFFDQSPFDYSCAGHPEQAVVPGANTGIWSPTIDVTTDAVGTPIGGELDSLVVEFDVYLEEEPTNLKAALGYLDAWAEGCLAARSQASWSSYTEEGTGWIRARSSWIPQPGADTIRLWLGVRNQGFEGLECRSHAPLYDNVRVLGYFTGATASDPAPSAPRFALGQNRPNPFNPLTTIDYRVPPGDPRVRLRIYDAAGRLVRTLVDSRQESGPQHARWDGRTTQGKRAASGVYFYELLIDEERATRKMVLLR